MYVSYSLLGSNMIVLTVAQSELKKPFKMKSDSQECRRAEVEAPTVSSAAAEAVEVGPCSEKNGPCTRTSPCAPAGRPQAGPALAPSPVPTRPGATARGPEAGSVRPAVTPAGLQSGPTIIYHIVRMQIKNG